VSEWWAAQHFSLANPREDGATDLPRLLRRLADETETRDIAAPQVLDVTIHQDVTVAGPWWSATVYWSPDSTSEGPRASALARRHRSVARRPRLEDTGITLDAMVPTVDEDEQARPSHPDTWFAVRCVFTVPGEHGSTYEERVTVWGAATMTDAVALAEAEAGDYAAAVGGQYTGLAQCYALTDEPGHGTEVFSLMRDSDLAVEAYLDRFFDTGDERQGQIDDAS
jgi:hypothetical protein